MLPNNKDITCLAPSPEPILHLSHLGIGLLVWVHKHCGRTYTNFLLVTERLHEKAAVSPNQHPTGSGALFSLGTYLRSVSFGVTLHILHSCQRVKTPNNPAAENRAGASCSLSRVPSWQSQEEPQRGLADSVYFLREVRLGRTE